MNPEDPAQRSMPESTPRPPSAAPEDRLTTIGELLGECRPPDMAGGYDQCAHGTWPCAITQAVWLAQGRDRDQEVHAACQAAQELEAEEASWEACQELLAAERDGRPPYWEAQAVAEHEAG